MRGRKILTTISDLQSAETMQTLHDGMALDRRVRSKKFMHTPKTWFRGEKRQLNRDRAKKKIIIITYYVILSIICVHPLFEPYFVSNFNALRSVVFFFYSFMVFSFC